ncbi:MAG: methyltransferase domain-containing protein [Pseudonocardia sp.]
MSTTTGQADAWRGHARHLAEQLVAIGDIHDPRWAAAIAETPRHLLVPISYRQDPDGAWAADEHNAGDVASAALARVYSTDTLVSAVRGGEAVSSSTKPDLMVRMLEALQIQDGMRVLEIGTGTGYNAALLCHRLRDQQVFSVDVEPELVATARERLAAIGLRPRLAARDGQTGWPEHAPYDRIIATCSLPAIPWSWAEQLQPEGLVVADVKLGPGAGNLAVLRRDGHQLRGRFTTRWAGFMAARPTHAVPGPRRVMAPAAVGASERETTAPAQPWATHREAWMLAALRLPAGTVHGYALDPDTRTPRAGRLSAPDGSWCEVALDPQEEPEGGPRRRVQEAGHTALWTLVEEAYRTWRAAGQPAWERFGLTVTVEQTLLWLDQPGNALGRYQHSAGKRRWEPVLPRQEATVPAPSPTVRH